MSVCNETPEELWKAGPFRRMQDASHACLLRFGARKGACLVVGAPKVVWCTHSTLVLVAHNMSVCNQTPEEMWQAGPFRRMQDASHAHACLLRFGTRKGACWVVGAPKVVWCTHSTFVLVAHNMSVCNETPEEMWQAGPFRRMQDASCLFMPVQIWCTHGSLLTQGSLLGCWCTKGSLVHEQHFGASKGALVHEQHCSCTNSTLVL
jgi:cell division protein FtsL